MFSDEFATEHAGLRLLQRSHELDKTLTELWEDGVACEVTGHSYDEARVVPSHDIVMLVKDGRVVTVLDDLSNVKVKGDELQDYIRETTMRSNNSNDRERVCNKCGFNWREPRHREYQTCPQCQDDN